MTAKVKAHEDHVKSALLIAFSTRPLAEPSLCHALRWPSSCPSSFNFFARRTARWDRPPGPTPLARAPTGQIFFISRGLTGHFYFFIFLVVKFFDDRPFFRTPARRPETVRNDPILGTVLLVQKGAFSQNQSRGASETLCPPPS